MGAADLLQRLLTADFDIQRRGATLLIGPSEKLTDALRGQVRAHKPELLQLVFQAEVDTADLLVAAMRVCDRHRDGPVARAQMRRDCLATPPHLRSDLLQHFLHTHPPAASGNESQ